MFKLESYITPLLMGYLDKYVKLRQEDFQLSLWGGDAVLNNLDLRLDELEKVIQLPVIFQSGHIHELRLHVPWTKLGSEPVVITINTVECIIKVRDTAYESTSSARSMSTPRHAFQQRLRVKRRTLPTEELPPGYLQSIVTRIINNVTFIINNLILKFVEDDIVLSVNIKSAECYSVDKEWNRAFIDLTPDDLALRKVLNFADLTVCLDKTNSSGHIESYQEPVAYRCAVTCRLYMEYESTVAMFPRVTRFNLYCDTLNLSLTDTQLPMLVRLIELCIALYYGTLDIPTSASGDEASEEPAQSNSETVEEDTDISIDSEMYSALDQGWVSWAWSYVPQILPLEEEELDAEKRLTEQERRGRPAPHVLSLGFYIHQGSVVFKLTEKSRESTELPHKKIHFHPFLKLSGEGLGIEVLLQGLTFCDIQCGFTAFRLSTCGSCICGVPDEKVARCNTLLSGGEPLDKKASLTYITNSLFDNLSCENRGTRSQYILDGEEHRQVYTEQQALQRYGAFWVDSLYTFEKPEKRGAGSSSSETDNSDLIFQKEYSTLRFVLGNTHLHVSSTLYHRVSKLIACAMNHQYQPYSSGKPSTVLANEDRPKPSEEQIQSLEEFIPTQLLHLMVINPTVTILSAEHPYCDVAKKSFKSRLKKRDSKTTEEPLHPPPLAAVVLAATRFDLQITKPMYAERLVKMVTAIAGPSSNLLHHCHIHTQIKAGLQRASWDGKMSRLLTLIPPCSFALYSRSLVLPKLWTNSSLPQQEWMYEIPNASLNVNKASCLLCTRVLSSWISLPEKLGADYILDDSLLDDLFPVSGESTHQAYPLLEIGLYGLEFKSCESSLVSACVASLSSFNVFLYTPGIGGKMSAIPIIYGPNDTSGICDPDFFTRTTLGKTEVRSDCLTTTFQKPKHAGVSEDFSLINQVKITIPSPSVRAQALALIDCQGLCVWLDPSLTTWFHYCPQPRPGRKNEHPPVTLDLSLAQMTSPLNAMSNASLHSTSSPSHPGRHPASMTVPPHLGRPTSIPEEDSEEKEKKKCDAEENSLGKILAQYFSLIRTLHVQVELKPSAVFLPKTTIPNSESSADILAIVHQARHAGRLSDTVVICVPSIVITSTMTKPMNIVQELPITSIQGSLIGEKLPWTVKISNMCVYSLHSGKQDPLFFLHPMDIVSTVAVNCKYSPPTSETISTLALCLHVDVGQPQVDISASQLQLFSTVMGMMYGLVSNASKLTEDCVKLFILKLEEKPLLTPRAPASHKKSASSTNKIESVRSADVTENITTDISEDFSHEGSPLHESIIDDSEEIGVKLSLWLQLLVPKMSCTVYGTCPVTDRENGIALSLEHFDLSMDSQNVYSKAKVTLSSINIQHSIRSQDGSWSWTDPEGIVLSCIYQLPHNLLTVTNKMWAAEHNAAAASTQSQDVISKDKKKSVLSVTFTCALCKNVKKRLRKANVDLPSVADPDATFSAADGEHTGSLKHDNVEFYFHEYLSEVCVKTEPLDIVLKPELFWVLGSLVAGLNKTGKSGKAHTLEFKTELPKLNHGTHDDSLFSSASVHNLPLIYADVGMIRVFIPKSSHIQAPGCVQQEMVEKPGSFEPGSQEEQIQSASLPVRSTIINIEVDPVSPQHIPTASLPSVSYSSKTGNYNTQVHTVQPVSGNKKSHAASSTTTPQHVEKPRTVNKAADHESRPPSEACCTLFHDMLVVHVKSCLLQPYADNPLPRIAQEKEVFHYAVQSGFTHQPGAVIEDRQYQVDIKGVSVSTGRWDQVTHEMKQGLGKTSQGSMVQIPALDWNTFLMDSPAHELKEIKLIPIVAPFDLCLVLAPPITYVCKENHFDSEKVKLICGFTCELNLTSDLDLYLNTSQVKLVTDIVAQCSEFDPHRPGAPVLQASPASHPAHDGWVKSHQPVDFAAGVDSGVESDLSTFTLDLGQRHVTHRPSPQISTDLRKMSGMVGGAGGIRPGRKVDKTEEELSKALGSVLPLDILVTAGRISCTVYSHKILEEPVILELPLFKEKRASQKQPDPTVGKKQCLINAKDNLEPILSSAAEKVSQGFAGGIDEESQEDDGSYVGEESFAVSKLMQVADDSLKKVIPRGSACIIPLIYVYMTQPHCIVAKHSTQEVKVEVSCYDILVKAASDQHVSAIDDYRIIPDSVDFNVHWLETRAGCPNPYTGIPPSLLTAKFMKEPSKPDTLSISLERPMRLKVSQLAVEQVTTLCSEMSSIFPGHDSKTASRADNTERRVTDKDSQSDILSLVERVEVRTSQIVASLELTGEGTSAGAVLSLEETTLEADIGRKEENLSLTAHVQLKDIVVKTNYEKKCRHLIGPFTVNMDGLLSWIPLSNDTFIPQVLVATEFSLVPITFGQEHMFCLSKLGQEVQRMIQDVSSAPSQCPPAEDDKVDKKSYSKASVDFVQDRSYDDLRCGGFQFIEQPEGSNIQPDVGEIGFSGEDPSMQESSYMIWHYPTPRVITRIHLTPVPFSLSSSNLSLDGSSSGLAEIPCVLQSWDELRGEFVDVTEFHLSENEAVLVNMPEPKSVNASELVVASVWRVLLLQPPRKEGSRTPAGDVAVLPSSLAACMCVDSACVPSLIPSVELSVSVPAAELHLCHHLKYNGTVLPKKLSLYDIHADLYEEQVFSIIKIENLSSTVSHVSGQEGKTSIKCSVQAGCDVLEYGHLTLEEVLTPAKINAYIDISSKDKKQDINGNVQMGETRMRVGKSAVHTLSMAVAAWTTFCPDSSGPHLAFSYYTLCNNTTSTIRFGQAGTDENIVLKSREMYAYTWRSHNFPQMLHLCMDKPSWKWTEPFPIDSESTSVRNVTARDQSYLVIIKVKRLGNLQMQVTVFGQLIVANHLSQSISMRISHSAIASTKEAKGENGEVNNYVIKSGTHLPSLVSSELLVNPVQFRLAGYTTSWSHDIFLSGDRMKDNQMVKILLPDGVTYFHVWCRIFCQHFHGMPQKLIMLTPLYVVRTHLPHPLYIHLDSPKVKKSQEMVVRSQGKEFQFHCMGGDVTHQMSFRLCSGMHFSSPAVVLSTGLIGQLVRNQVSSMDIEQMCEQVMDTHHEQWPYLTDDPNTELDPGSHVPSSSQVSLSDERDWNQQPGSLDTSEMAFEQQPGIDLNVRLSEYIPGCDTLLVEVSPPYLVHNATDIDMVIFGSEGKNWCISPGQTLAPPLVKEEFKLSVNYQTAVSAQKSIPMSEETMDYRRYNGDIGRVLFIDGYVHVAFQISLQEANKMEVLFLTITSSEQNGIRVICIRERFALANQTGRGLVLKLLALPLSLQQVRMSQIEAVSVVSAAEQDEGNVLRKESRGQGLKTDSQQLVPLLRWSTDQRYPLQDVDGRESENEDVTYVYYVSFALNASSGRTSGDWGWSFPVRIISSKDGHRMTTSVPDHVVTDLTQGEQTPVSHAVCVVTQQVRGVTHIVVTNDAGPACIVENLCPFGLEFGQACDKLTGSGVTVQEQVELVSDLPWVPAGGWCHYTPPIINSDFVTKDTISIPKLHFRATDIQLPEPPSAATSEWSTGVQITGNPDAFVRLPNYCDLKIMIQVIGMVTHLVIRPVSKAEITAKEIRSRIMDRGEVKVVTQEYQPKKRVSQDSKMDSSVDLSSSESADASESVKETSSVCSESSSSSVVLSTSASPAQAAVSTSSTGKLVMNKKLVSTFTRFSDKDKSRKDRDLTKKVSFTFGVLCSSFTLTLQDESHLDVVSDLVSVHFRDLFFAVYPVSRGPDQLGTETSFAVSVGEAQIDNQQYGVEAFDFPVILLPQKVKNSSTTTLSPQNFLNLSVIELHAVMKSKAFLHVQVVTFTDTVWDQSGIEMVDISMKPVSLYVEDTFIYRLIEELEAFIPDRPSAVSDVAMEVQGALNRKLPAVVKVNSYTLSHPIRVKHMTIQPIKMLLSVHASLKLFLASDHTPLSMSKFERVNVYATLHRIAHTLTVHYASAAVFRAGIVVGSLEILGNPTGLVRSIGTGVSDLISLPYSGLTRGPGAFVTGLTMGFGSLVKNVSAGMITSVTNFASSVSRNMDRLSFDSTHLERQEENRRNRPVGVSDGLKQGLTGFGISLLGAVAGLADQPIQTLLASETQDKPRASASSTASGLVTGVGKGLVGIFTKPIGGAAEFVSQTGQGILHGTGLAQLQTRLEKPANRCRRERHYGAFKYAEKIFTSLPNPELLLVVPAVTFDLTGSEVKVELLLTPDVLVVVNCEEDAQQQAFTLSELECRRSYDDDEKVIVQWLDQFYAASSGEQSHNSNKDRIAAFIDTQNASGYPVGTLIPFDQSVPAPHSDSQSEPGMPTQGHSRQHSSSNQSETRPTHDSQSVSSPQYVFQMKPYWQDLFLTVFRLAKNKLQGKRFPV